MTLLSNKKGPIQASIIIIYRPNNLVHNTDLKLKEDAKIVTAIILVERQLWKAKNGVDRL